MYHLILQALYLIHYFKMTRETILSKSVCVVISIILFAAKVGIFTQKCNFVIHLFSVLGSLLNFNIHVLVFIIAYVYLRLFC